MDKTVLITGSTDGIGKMTALEMAKKDYTIHVHGRNEKRGRQVLQKLKKINSEKNHKFYKADLSSIQSNIDFLNRYSQENKSLDLLILNALAVPNKILVTEDKLELTFAVGFISRYIFSIKLKSLLLAGEDSRVIHMGEGYRANKIDISKIYDIKPSNKETSIWDKFKYNNIAYVADGILTYHINQNTKNDIAHEYYHPGFVNTKQVKEAPRFIKILGKLFTPLIEPEKSAEFLTKHVIKTTSREVDRNYYSMGKLKKTPSKMKNSHSIFTELMNFSKRITNLELK